MRLTKKERKIRRPAWASRLVAARIRTGLTASAFARSIGLSQQRYNAYEQGLNEPSLSVWRLLKDALGPEEIYFVVFGEHIRQPSFRDQVSERPQFFRDGKK
jgi:transcriptional regulator with XRE-family HTH domain